MKASVNDYFRQNKVRILLFGLFTAFVSFLAPLKSFQLKWLIDSSSKNEAFAYLGLVFTITFASWLFELLSRRSFTKLACGAVEQVRNQVMECVLHRSVAQYNNESDAVYLSLLTTDLRTLYDDYYMSIFNVVFWGGIMLCALGLYLYISPILLVAILLVTIPPLVLPRIMNDQLTHARNKFSAQMAEYTGQLKELMGGFELIRAFLREDSYDNQHRVASHKAAESELTYQQSLNSVIVNTSLISTPASFSALVMARSISPMPSTALSVRFVQTIIRKKNPKRRKKIVTRFFCRSLAATSCGTHSALDSARTKPT